MITTTILAILGLLLLVVLWMMMRAPSGKAISAPARQPQLPTRTDLHPSEARKGDVISIHGAATDFSDLDFTIDERDAFESNGRRWVNLTGEFRGDRVYLEVQPKPSTEVVGILDPRKLSLADVQLTEQRLIDLDKLQDPNQSITFDGKTWNYESSRELGFFEHELGEGEGLYRWLFDEQNGDRLLCVEKWEGEPFDVRIARRLNIRDIVVYPAA